MGRLFKSAFHTGLYNATFLFITKGSEKNPVPFQEIKVTFKEAFILDNPNSKYTKQYVTRGVLSTPLPLTPEQILTFFNIMCSESPFYRISLFVP